MSTESLLTAWTEAGRRFTEAIQIEDLRARVAELQAVQAEWTRLFPQLIEIAETSDPEVWLCIGAAYAYRRGTDKNPEEAKRWFQRAAEAGNTAGMVALGLLLNHPETPESHPAAVEWFRKAATLGSARGMVWMGFACREGQGTAKDDQEAIQWFGRAFHTGDIQSAVHAGRIYARNLSNQKKAEEWFLRAAEAGWRESHIELAMLYDDQESPCHNAAAAVTWFAKVAAENSGSVPRAMIALARHSRDGDGMPQSKEVAKEWLHKVMERTDPKSSWFREAAKLLEEIEESLL